MSDRKKRPSTTADVDFIVNALEVLSGALGRCLAAVVVAPVHLLCFLMKLRRSAGDRHPPV